MTSTAQRMKPDVPHQGTEMTTAAEATPSHTAMVLASVLRETT